MRVVVVAAEGEATRRAALSLSTHPDVEVALLGPTTSSQFPVVDSAIGYDAVVGSERAAIEAGIPAVVPGALERHFGVEHCSIAGLALALAADLEGVGTVAVAVPGAGGGDQEVTFPSPIDSRRARAESFSGRTVFVADSPDDAAAALALGQDRHRVILDDHRFMEGVALAAGVGVLLAGYESGPVWRHAPAYLQTATEMGLVIGERPA